MNCNRKCCFFKVDTITISRKLQNLGFNTVNTNLAFIRENFKKIDRQSKSYTLVNENIKKIIMYSNVRFPEFC